MGIEGGGRFESLDRKHPGDSRRRVIEARGDHSPEDAAERKNYWLAGMGVTPETLEQIRQYPAHKESSTEYLVYMLLLGKLVEEGTEWDSQRKARVRNLVGVLRAVAFSNMTEWEQSSLRELSKATTFNMRELQYDVTPDIVSDVRWIWKTLGLQVPRGDRSVIFETPVARPQLKHPQEIE